MAFFMTKYESQCIQTFDEDLNTIRKNEISTLSFFLRKPILVISTNSAKLSMITIWTMEVSIYGEYIQ